MKNTDATNCQTRWWPASSMVIHEAKKLGTRSTRLLVGRNALRVNRNPITLTKRKSHDTPLLCQGATTVRARRHLPVPRDTHPPHARGDDRGLRPLLDARRLFVRAGEGLHRQPGASDRAVPSPARRGAVPPPPPPVGRRPRVRPRLPRPSHRCPTPGGPGRARSRRRADRQHPPRPLEAAVGGLGHRGPRRRQRRSRGEGPPLRRRRKCRRRVHGPPVRPRPRRRPSRTARADRARARPVGRRAHVSRRRLTDAGTARHHPPRRQDHLLGVAADRLEARLGAAIGSDPPHRPGHTVQRQHLRSAQRGVQPDPPRRHQSREERRRRHGERRRPGHLLRRAPAVPGRDRRAARQLLVGGLPGGGGSR